MNRPLISIITEFRSWLMAGVNEVIFQESDFQPKIYYVHRKLFDPLVYLIWKLIVSAVFDSTNGGMVNRCFNEIAMIINELIKFIQEIKNVTSKLNRFLFHCCLTFPLCPRKNNGWNQYRMVRRRNEILFGPNWILQVGTLIVKVEKQFLSITWSACKRVRVE